MTQASPADHEKGELRQAGRAWQLGRGDRHRRQRVDADEDDEHDASR